MPIKEYKVKTSENEKLKWILERFKGEILIIGDETEEEGGEPVVESNKQFEDEVREKLDIINRIRERGKVLKKEAISELYEIGEHKDEDWGE